jgi:octaprenyl-diphosphate synthase
MSILAEPSEPSAPIGARAAAPPPSSPGRDVLGGLTNGCAARGLEDTAARLGEMRDFLGGDLEDVERALAVSGAGDTLAHRSAQHLLAASGKRLRPLCVALASRTGGGFGPAARDLAIAVELVHAATLLHDDVVDLGDKRRGADAARLVYGNAASIFGGDWLLVEALGRIRGAGLPDVLDRMLEVIKEMVVAEALQLARRGRVSTSRDEYFEVAHGKTASLFRWAMFAGARAGGVSGAACEALEAFGEDLGVAFQVVDDVLDVAGDPEVTGKSVLTDLREGKMTYPLIVAAERDPSVGRALAELLAPDAVPADAALRSIAAAASAPAVVEHCLETAERLCASAVTWLDAVPVGRARSALESVAVATLHRSK